eukprot:78823-Chlamydomonas_euryale.AAC.11
MHVLLTLCLGTVDTVPGYAQREGVFQHLGKQKGRRNWRLCAFCLSTPNETAVGHSTPCMDIDIVKETVIFTAV